MVKMTENIKSNHQRAGRRSHVKEGELRQTIIDAATAVFADCGYEEASISDIATRAGVTKPLIFYYFGSKQTLFLEILSQVHQASYHNFERMILENTQPFADLMRHIVDVSVSFFQSSDAKMRFFSAISSFRPNQDFFDQNSRHMELVYNLLLTACQRAYSKKEIITDPETTARSIYAVLSFNLFHLNARKYVLHKKGEDCIIDGEDAKKQINKSLELILRGANLPA